MIRTAPQAAGRGPAINPLRGEFELPVAGEPCRFDTRLSTVALIETACGERAIVEILNGIIAERRARDVMPLLAAALVAAGRGPAEAEALAASATVGEAEAFVLALIFALGFTVGRPGERGGAPPLAEASSGGAGASSRSAA